MRLLTALSFAATLAPARAQDPDRVRQLAQMDFNELSQVRVVSAARHQQNQEDSPRQVSVITAEELRRRNYRNVPEALAELTGVFLQQTNYGGGSPILRGMVGNRILILVNGIRLNNSTYRLGPNQYLNFIDLYQVDRIEVIRGTGSVLYGSDALGGTINVITRAPPAGGGKEFSARTFVRFASADRSGSGRAEFSASRGRLTLLGGYTRQGFGDLRAGAPVGLQPFTGYGQWAGDLEASYSLAPEKVVTVGLQRIVLEDVPRTDVLASGADREHFWDREGRDLAHIEYRQAGVTGFIDNLEIRGAYQQHFENLNRIASAQPQIERRHRDSVGASSLNVQFGSGLGSRQLLTYGLEFAHERVGSLRTDVNMGNGSAAALTGNYPDGAHFTSYALFGQDEIQLGRKLSATLGLRYDRFGLAATANDPKIGQLAVNAAPSAVTGSGYLLYKLSRRLDLMGGMSQGFRAPDLDDTSVLGGVSSTRFEVPNPALDPERVVDYEVGLRAHGGGVRSSFSMFHTHYRNLIDRAPATFAGLDFIDLNGNRMKDASEPTVLQRQNIGEAHVHGLEADAAARFNEKWSLAGSLTWTRGTDTLLDVPLTRIPPPFGLLRLGWKPAKWIWVEAVGLGAARQDRLSPADKLDRRINPNGTPGFAVFHLRAGLEGTPLAGLTLAVENLANRDYRLHGSGLDRPGVNLAVGFSKVF